MNYVCFDCSEEFEPLQCCKECGVALCERCFKQNDGICEECAYGSDGMQ